MTVYIAGPVSGMPRNNLPAFRGVADLLAQHGIDFVIPHDIYTSSASPCPAIIWVEAMLKCIPELERCDAVLFLAGWEMSAGCRREMQIAIANKIKIFTLDGIEKLINNNGRRLA